MINKILQKLAKGFCGTINEDVPLLRYAEMTFYSIPGGEPLNAFTDQDECRFITSLILADVDGQFPDAFIYITPPYKVVVKDRFGRDIFQQDYLK